MRPRFSPPAGVALGALVAASLAACLGAPVEPPRSRGEAAPAGLALDGGAGEIALPVAAYWPPLADDGPSPPLAATLAAILQRREGTYGLVVEHLGTRERLVHNPRRVFASGSVYKLAVAHEVLRQVDAGRFKLDDRLLIEPRDTVEPEPARGLDAGDEVTVREALRAMLGVSSNSAAHALLRLLDRTRFNASLRALGLRDTRVPLGHDEVATTTPADMALLLRELARGSVLRYESSAELRRLLTPGQDLNALADALPDDVEVLSKAGNLERASNVAALVSTAQGPVIICVFDEDVDPGDARQTIADLTRAVYAHHAR